MRKMLMAGVLAGATMLAPGLTPEARASHGWLGIGTAFRVGAAHIAFIFGTPFGYEPAYYFRYDRPIRYSGYHCSRYCFHDGGYYYHHESCPLVGAHFRNYGVDPYSAFSRYAPRFDGYDDYGGYSGGYYGGGYDGSGGYGRYDDGRYDRYDDGRYDRYDDRYDRRDRYDRHDRRDRYDRRSRRHRHHRGCGHY